MRQRAPRLFPARWAPAFVIVAVLGLAACGNASPNASGATDSPSPTTTSTSTATTTPTTSPTTSGSSLPVVHGAVGAKPDVVMPGGNPPSTLVTKTLVTGKGPTVASGDLLVVNYVGLLWRTGGVFDSSFSRGQPAAFAIGVGKVIPGWDKGLVGQTVGSRVLLVIPPADGYGDSGQPSAGIKGTDTLVFVVDILGSYGANDAASGKPTPTQNDALPAVTVLPKKPDIAIPPGDPPRKLIAVPVVTGKGPKVHTGDLVICQYVGKVWATDKQFDASWDHGQPVAVQIGVGQVIPGFDSGLVGQTVGSRVLLVIPPAQGFGPKGQPSAGIKPTDTLVFAVDILAAFPTTSPQPSPSSS